MLTNLISEYARFLCLPLSYFWFADTPVALEINLFTFADQVSALHPLIQHIEHGMYVDL